ncbi:nucleotidyltransferase domain-containing protein [Deinococcus sp. SM5_A1]|uniref:nucleotidyltransferase domain-containing protein n=1 Tax=Deinococcus sp. SM5_A1 TaxID=3379094 RepID=UPI00385858CB
MSDLNAAIHELRNALGDYLEGGRQEGVFHAQTGGPGSVPALSGLDLPELHLDLLPERPSEEQRSTLLTLGYVPEGESYLHPAGWRLVLLDHSSGWRAEQQALRALLLADSDAASRYRQVFLAEGRQAADEALKAEATAHHARTVGFAPAQFVAQALTELEAPWMFAGGLALDLHLNRITRPHDDLDVAVAREAQPQLLELFSDWKLDAPQGGMYQPWTAPLEPPLHQIHARHPALPDVLMLDLLLTDLSGGLWHYRRDPRVTLPLAEARLWSSAGWPYLAPQAALLFKAAADRKVRGKDARDFERVRPTLDGQALKWLRGALELLDPEHPWLERLH